MPKDKQPNLEDRQQTENLEQDLEILHNLLDVLVTALAKKAAREYVEEQAKARQSK